MNLSFGTPIRFHGVAGTSASDTAAIILPGLPTFEYFIYYTTEKITLCSPGI